MGSVRDTARPLILRFDAFVLRIAISPAPNWRGNQPCAAPVRST